MMMMNGFSIGDSDTYMKKEGKTKRKANEKRMKRRKKEKENLLSAALE